jgi:putative DNA-invertase from lambdoid prophage Rac
LSRANVFYALVDLRYFLVDREMLGQQAVGVAQIAMDTKLTRQTIYRIKDDPAGTEAALSSWGL